MKKYRVPCLNIIGNKIALSLCYVCDKHKCNFVEARSALVPVKIEEKNNLLKVIELLVFLKVRPHKKMLILKMLYIGETKIQQ